MSDFSSRPHSIPAPIPIVEALRRRSLDSTASLSLSSNNYTNSPTSSIPRPSSRPSHVDPSVFLPDDDTLFPLTLTIAARQLPPPCNPLIGVFSVDSITGHLNFLCHTEYQKLNSSPNFTKPLYLNYLTGRNQKIQLNVYNAKWSETDEASGHSATNSIAEEDRIGSVVIALDKIPSLSNRVSFIPLQLELPLWHDTNVRLNAKLQQRTSTIRVGFKASDPSSSVGPLKGPNTEHLISMQQ